MIEIPKIIAICVPESGQVMAATLGWMISVVMHFRKAKNDAEKKNIVFNVRVFWQRNYEEVLLQVVCAYALVYVGLEPIIDIFMPQLNFNAVRFSSFICGLMGAQIIQRIYEKWITAWREKKSD